MNAELSQIKILKYFYDCLGPEKPVEERERMTEVPSPVRTVSPRPVADTPTPPHTPTRIPAPTHPSGRPRRASLTKTPPPSHTKTISSPSNKVTPPSSTQTTPPFRVQHSKRGRESEDEEPEKMQRQQRKRQRTDREKIKKDKRDVKEETKKDTNKVTKDDNVEEEAKKETVDEKVCKSRYVSHTPFHVPI